MIRAVVNPGICGMSATVEVYRVGKRRVRLSIASDCDKVKSMSKALLELDSFDALKPHVSSSVYMLASEHHLCTSCPLPMAILKATEIETGLALPKSVDVRFETVAQSKTD
ncbi:MAG: hypothetical protein JW732_03440 [Dehalococcoidia bacterium]|nr:hypothetical protein [Dehalococcoidia bacterium]